MSITITTDVFCDRCPHWAHGTTGPRPAIREARARVKAVGWRHLKGEDICPMHIEPEAGPSDG